MAWEGGQWSEERREVFTWEMETGLSGSGQRAGNNILRAYIALEA